MKLITIIVLVTVAISYHTLNAESILTVDRHGVSGVLNTTFKLKGDDDKFSRRNLSLFGSNGERSHVLTYASIGLGVVAGGLSYYFYNQGNTKYDEYEAATKKQEAVDLYDEAQGNDTKALISAGIGGGLIAFGIMYELFLNKGDSYFYSSENSRLSVRPIQTREYSGIHVALNFR
jgi:hypothetical protein